LVPPSQQLTQDCPRGHPEPGSVESSPRKTPGKSGLEINATSGTSRWPSAGVTPFCHEGLANIALAPPPVAPPASFQAFSGANPTSSPLASKLGVNCVPPTPVALGSAAISFTWRLLAGTQVCPEGSRTDPAAP